MTRVFEIVPAAGECVLEIAGAAMTRVFEFVPAAGMTSRADECVLEIVRARP